MIKLLCANQHCNCVLCDERDSAVLNTTMEVNDTFLWSTLQCSDQHLQLVTKVTVWWSTLQCVWRTVRCYDQTYSVSELYSAVINTTGRWSTLQIEWRKLLCVDQHYRASFELYLAVINTTVGWSIQQSDWRTPKHHNWITKLCFQLLAHFLQTNQLITTTL